MNEIQYPEGTIYYFKELDSGIEHALNLNKYPFSFKAENNNESLKEITTYEPSIEVISDIPTLKRITLHEFRKTHVSLCAMVDMNLEDIMYRVGHKDSKMTRQVYNYF